MILVLFLFNLIKELQIYFLTTLIMVSLFWFHCLLLRISPSRSCSNFHYKINWWVGKDLEFWAIFFVIPLPTHIVFNLNISDRRSNCQSATWDIIWIRNRNAGLVTGFHSWKLNTGIPHIYIKLFNIMFYFGITIQPNINTRKRLSFSNVNLFIYPDGNS